ncbi:hypothetical protein L1987_48106 [Smallanthus sonchifolius]|uniref:Uncharacterized protein n=1 Tax=Smallanthus sonchifolius TaxID=185202 RepID=A0ACB9FS55_9ASTR|nr:hypothetical protein L1987_48106 [Smallanthus sonchifolius]
MEINKLLFFSLSLALILGFVQSFDYNEKELESEEGLKNMYNRWRDHHKVTEKSTERFNVFKANVQHVHNHNKMNKPYKLKINKFADMTHKEFRSNFASDNNDPLRNVMLQAGGAPPPPPGDVKDLPPRVDWREKNAVTAVRTRGQCGSTNLFAAVGSVEGINAIRTGQLITLSEQQFLDCFEPGMHSLADVFNWFKEKGVATAESYPYVGSKGTCDESKFGRYLVTIDGFERVLSNEEAMMKVVAQQPVAFFISLGPDVQSYSEGIYSGPCGMEGDAETMLIVGYGETSDGTKYWIVKNVLGEEWGEKGYVRLPRGLQQPLGYCDMYGYNLIPLKSIETRNTEL